MLLKKPYNWHVFFFAYFRFDVTETQVTIMTLHLFNFLFGSHIWSFQVKLNTKYYLTNIPIKMTVVHWLKTYWIEIFEMKLKKTDFILCLQYLSILYRFLMSWKEFSFFFLFFCLKAGITQILKFQT